MGEHTTRVIIFGLDGASLEILKFIRNETSLQNFDRVINEGFSGRLVSTMPYVSAPAWASIFSGVNPGKHGIFDLIKLKKEVVPVNLLSSEVPLLWDRLTLAGKRIVVLGAPFTYPAPRVEGVFVTGFASPRLSTFPSDLADRLRARGYVSIPNDIRIKIIDSGKKSMVDELISGFKVRSNFALEFMTDGCWDAFIFIINITDQVHHFAIDDIKLLCKVYEVIDAVLGEVINKMGKNDLLLIVSDHGHVPIHKVFLLNQWLIDKGLLTLNQSLIRSLVSKLSIDLEKMLASRFVRKIYQYIQKLSPELVHFWESIILSNLPSAMPFISVSKSSKALGINVNEPVAWVKLFVKNKEMRSNLISKLSQNLCNITTSNGEKVIKRVLKTEEVYNGPYTHKAPGDLLVEATEGFAIDTWRLNSYNTLVDPLPYKRGAHCINGIFIAYGSSVGAGEITANICDITPTVLHYLGLPIASYSDGRVLMEIYKSGAGPLSREPQFIERIEEGIKGKYSLSKEDEKAVKERLKALGYLS